MKSTAFHFGITLITALFLNLAAAQEQIVSDNFPDLDEWTASEYSGSREASNIRTAMISKGFTWLSGSPADNEKLSIGKNAQFFGFVALRAESGRAANRGTLGRAFFAISSDEQRDYLIQAVIAEDPYLEDWWHTRGDLLEIYEQHLYTGLPFDEEAALAIGAEFSRFGTRVALHEAIGFAALEDSLTDDQLAQIWAWRSNPELAQAIAQDSGNNIRVRAVDLESDQYKQLEDLFAKAFSWITGTPEDNEIIPLGQPAQFFGFVSIRHKSGHGANRGQIARSFGDILNTQQLAVIDEAVAQQMPVVKRYLETRQQFLEQLALLRTDTSAFDADHTMALGDLMGDLEIEAGWIEAKAYRRVRETMNDEQISQMMSLRGDYVLDETQVELLSSEQRGEQLAILCAGCHGEPGQHRATNLGPSLDAIFDRPIASATGFEYSEALQQFSGSHWTLELLDQFLAEPKAFAPGTKMEFQGLLNIEDRKALIEYLQK